MISVNDDDRRAITDEIQRKFPEAKTFDMEKLHSELIHDDGKDLNANNNNIAPATVAEASTVLLPINGNHSGTRIRFQNGGKHHQRQKSSSSDEEEEYDAGRLQSYEEDLRKRREREERQVKEQEFLR